MAEVKVSLKTVPASAPPFAGEKLHLKTKQNTRVLISSARRQPPLDQTFLRAHLPAVRKGVGVKGRGRGVRATSVTPNPSSAPSLVEGV